ncbi:MAG: PAS domain-containing protein [Chitinophagaceae bacterium]
MSAEIQSRTVTEQHSFLSLGGEMGQLIREMDWSANPLGDPGSWSQSLRTIISVVLRSKFPMFLWWGPDLICLYNDAYRPSLGDNGKHPSILGMAAAAAWPEIWDTIEPLIAQVQAGGEATWSEDQLIPIYRNGELQEVYWTFSYSPVEGDNGQVAGVLVICNETTDKVLTYIKLEESKEQLEFAIDAADLGTFDFNPITNKFACNDRLKDWFGLPSAPEIDLRTAIDVMVESDRPRVTEAISKALDYNFGSYDIEYTIINPSTKKEMVLQARGKTWFDDQHIAYRFNGTVEDVTVQVKARREIAESEERFRSMAEGMDILVAVGDESSNASYFNKAWTDLTGKPVADLLGFGWSDLIHPEDKDVYIGSYLAAFEKREVFAGEFRILNKDGNYGWLLAKVRPRFSPDDSFAGYIASCIDITDRKQSEDAFRESERRFRALVENAPFPMGVYTGKDMVVQIINQSILEVWGKGNEVIGKKYADVLPELKGSGIYEQLDGVYTSGQTFEAYNQRIELMIDGALRPYYFNYTFTPLFDATGRVYGVLNTAADVTDLNLANNKIEKSAKEFMQLADSLPAMVWTTDPKGVQIYASARWKEYTGLDPYGEASFAQMVHPDDLPRVIETWTGCLATGDIYKIEVRLRSCTDHYEWFYVNGEPIKDAGGNIEKWIGTFTNINEQKKATEYLAKAFQKVEESEKRFRNVADSAPVLIWLSGMDKKCTWFNKAWLSFTGNPLESELGDGWAAGVHPDDFEHCLETYTRSFDNRAEFYMEYRLKCHTGEYRWLSDTGVPRFTMDGVFEGYIGACMDIHKTAIYQQDLKEKEEKLNIVVDASELGIWELDIPDLKPKYSPRYLEIIGHTGSEHPTHEELLSHIHPGDLDMRNEAFTIAFEAGTLHFEARVIWADGSLHWIDARGKVFYDKANKPVKMIGTIRDITDEKNYQEELQEREQKFRLLADSMPQHIWTADPDGNLNYFNQSVYQYSGLTPHQVFKDGWLQIVHPDDRELNIGAWMHSIGTGTDFLIEHRFRRHDGEYRWQLSRAMPQRDADGNVQMWVGTSTDIQAIKEQDQQKDYFISMASHELKTPITSIKGYVQILQATYQDAQDPFLIKSLNIVDRQIITLTNLISDLLDLSKIKAGSLSFNKTDFDIDIVIKEVIGEVKLLNPAHHFIFADVCAIRVHADKDKICQVLINLFTNAVKYSPGSDEITVTCAADDKQVTVSVKDHGIGISKIDQEKIFERFYRVEGKNEKTFPGFGIGLFIASEIIYRHNGTIGVKSEPGKGSVFYFTLPIDTTS